MSRSQSLLLAAVIGILALAAGLLLARTMMPRTGMQATLASATVLEPARPLPPLAFVDHTGAPFGNEQLRGGWSFLFFGFTSCPDVCPMTLGLLAQTEKQLANLPEALRPQVVLVSVDPKRDTPEQLAAYVKFFSPSFTGITAGQDEVDELTRQMGVPVALRPLDNGGYTVDHSAAIFLIDPDGALRALFSTPHTPQLIAEDYRRITAAR